VNNSPWKTYWMPQYRWNTADVGVKHQSMNQCIWLEVIEAPTEKQT
jgi:hypothetical protein